MRVLPIIASSAVLGLMLGAGMSAYATAASPTALPGPIAGKGPRFLLPAVPADEAEAGGGWLGDGHDEAPATPATHRSVAETSASEAASGSDIYYPGCHSVRQAGKAQLQRGEAGFREGTGGDVDGLACEPQTPAN